MEKPILSFFVGYTRDFINSDQGIFGAEIALKNLAEELSLKYNVYIFGPCIEENYVGGVNYKNSVELEDFARNYDIEVMIVHRYIYYFLEFEASIARKTYIWFHDIGAQHSWDFKKLPYGGRPLLKNNLQNIEKIIVLTKWHRNHVLAEYKLPEDKVEVIGNGVKEELMPGVKNKDSFIWFQSPDRGLMPLLKNFYKVREVLPTAVLDIYGDETWLLERGFDFKSMPNYIRHHGKVSNEELLENLKNSEYWIYTLQGHETYCMAALEAQLAGCVCIATNSTGLAETLGYGRRGILLDKEYNSDEYWNELIENLKELERRPELKEKYKEKAIDWAKKQTWKNKAKEWIELIR